MQFSALSTPKLLSSQRFRPISPNIIISPGHLCSQLATATPGGSERYRTNVNPNPNPNTNPNPNYVCICVPDLSMHTAGPVYSFFWYMHTANLLL